MASSRKYNLTPEKLLFAVNKLRISEGIIKSISTPMAEILHRELQQIFAEYPEIPNRSKIWLGAHKLVKGTFEESKNHFTIPTYHKQLSPGLHTTLFAFVGKQETHIWLLNQLSNFIKNIFSKGDDWQQIRNMLPDVLIPFAEASLQKLQRTEPFEDLVAKNPDFYLTYKKHENEFHLLAATSFFR